MELNTLDLKNTCPYTHTHTHTHKQPVRSRDSTSLSETKKRTIKKEQVTNKSQPATTTTTTKYGRDAIVVMPETWDGIDLN